MPSSASGDATPFRPAWYARGGHVQTILGFFARRKLVWTLPVEDLVVESEPGIRILGRVTWRPGERSSAPALVLLHGMGGADDSTYMISMGIVAHAAGFHVVRVNMRGAGASSALTPRLYNAGLESDLVAVIREVARDVPSVFLFGASLGANHVLLALGRSRDRLPAAVRAAIAISPPVDLAACSAALHARRNWIYYSRFTKQLKATYAEVQPMSGGYYEAGREIGVTTVREFDERITAPYGGFGSADDYYAKSSSGPWLHAIDRPTLILSAEDDPMIPGDSVRRFARSGSVTLEMMPTGGHVAFVAPTTAPGSFWPAERAMAFYLSPRVTDTDPSPLEPRMAGSTRR